jgi:hypothetical protein
MSLPKWKTNSERSSPNLADHGALSSAMSSGSSIAG